DGIRVGGKTGTTQVLDAATGRYRSDRHIASFVGFAPADDPRVCMAVVVCEPQGESYGGKVAAPVFGRILARGAQLLRERPNRIRDRRRALRVEELEGSMR
ncbi:MAG TPA: penicillin-binding transpeptidase domain-containing protein, partial [Planctomycetota bacterium]|nr:penicillin-binding transpeptidase domain-containing protein [Planctomycetota bacterium]